MLEWTEKTVAVNSLKPYERNLGYSYLRLTQKGERHGRRFLTLEQVKEIRASSESSYALAPKYKVSPSQIQRIKSGKNWAHAA